MKKKKENSFKGSFGALPLSLHPLSLPQEKKKPEKGKKKNRWQMGEGR